MPTSDHLVQATLTVVTAYGSYLPAKISISRLSLQPSQPVFLWAIWALSGKMRIVTSFPPVLVPS